MIAMWAKEDEEKKTEVKTEDKHKDEPIVNAPVAIAPPTVLVPTIPNSNNHPIENTHAESKHTDP